MKKFRLSFLLLSLLLIAVGARADEITVNDGTDKSGFIPVYGYYADANTRGQFIIPAKDLADVSKSYITQMTFYSNNENLSWGNAEFKVSLCEVDKESFSSEESYAYQEDGLTEVYSGSLSIVDGKMVVEFDAPYQYGGGNLLVDFTQTVKGSYLSVEWLGVNAAGGSILGYSYTSLSDINNVASIGFLPKTTFTYSATANTCKKPKNLTISDVTSSSAVASWTSDGDTWQVCIDGDENNLLEVTENPTITLVNRKPGSEYTVKVRTVCGKDEFSEWTDVVTFTTDCEEEDKCFISYELNAGYSGQYGWWGASMKVVDHETGQLYDTWTLATGVASKEGTLEVCPGRTLDFVWTTGAYDNLLCAYTIKDVNGEVIAKRELGESSSIGVCATYTVDCTVSDCLTPTDLTASDVTPNTVTLSWTENGASTSWIVYYMAESNDRPTSLEASENPFSILGLQPETTYYVQVAPTCNPDKKSNMISFTTPVACPLPEDVAVETTPTSATISWTGYSESYNVKYREIYGEQAVFFEDFENGIPQTWTTIDNDGDGYNWFLYTPETNNDGHGNPVAFGKGCATSESYRTTALTPDNWLITPQIDLQGTLKVWLRGQDPSWCDEHFAIYLSTTGNDVKDFKTVLVSETVAKDAYTEYIADLSAYAGQKGYIAIRHFNCTDMFRLNVDNFGIYDVDASDWTTINTEEETVEITDLTPGTNYQYQIQGVCSEEDSRFVSGIFTTLVSCPVPTDINLTDVTTNSATVTWTGYSDNYEVRYRTPEGVETFFFDDFESGLSQWKVVQNGEGTSSTSWHSYNPSNFQNPIPAHSGNFVAIGRSWASEGYHVDNWLITPEVTLDGTLKFWVIDDGTYHEHYDIYVSTKGNDIADFGDEPFFSPGNASSSWKEVSVDLSEFKGQKGYIALRLQDYDKDYLIIDDFGIYGDEIPAGEWQTITTDEATAEITGLEPGTEYELQVRGFCDDTSTMWSDIMTFTTVAIAVDLALLDDDLAQPEGSKNTDLLAANFGKLANVTLKDRVFYKDGNWNTLCLPFNLTEEQIANSPLAEATIKQLYSANVTGTHVDMAFSQATEITSDWFYIFKWEEQGENIVNPVFNGVTIDYPYEDGPMIYTTDFKFWVMGNYSTVVADPSKDEVYAYYLGADNKLRYSEEPVNLHTFRLYFNFFKSDVDPSAIEFNLNFDGEESTGIVEVDGARKAAPEGTYNLQGVKINEPKQKGVYISNGRKVVVK